MVVGISGRAGEAVTLLNVTAKAMRKSEVAMRRMGILQALERPYI